VHPNSRAREYPAILGAGVQPHRDHRKGSACWSSAISVSRLSKYLAITVLGRVLRARQGRRGVAIDYAAVHRWSIKILPVLAAVFRRRKRPVGISWQMDETYIKVAGQWKHLYRAVDRAGTTIDFLLRAHRDYAAARRFFERAIELHGVPEKITIDKSGASRSTSTTSSSRIIEPSNASPGRCSASRPLAAHASC